MTKAARRVTTALAVLLLQGCAAFGGHGDGPSRRDAWIRLDPPRVVDQHAFAGNACGPAAMATSLLAEGGAARGAVEGRTDSELITRSVRTYGTRPSSAYEGSQRFAPASGVCAEDLDLWFDDWRADVGLPPHDAAYLDRAPDEGDAAFCARVHAILVRSLELGAPPVVRLRSFATHWYPARSAYLWDGVAAHWVTIVGVPSELTEGALGFAFDYADPATGTVERGFASVETQRSFAAARGNERTWEWREGSPFLLVTAPALAVLGRRAEAFYLREVVTLDHAVVARGALPSGPEE
ncbi:MAG: hypothetical protein R3F34_20260 [Planctomycetota bacterium]